MSGGYRYISLRLFQSRAADHITQSSRHPNVTFCIWTRLIFSKRSSEILSEVNSQSESEISETRTPFSTRKTGN